MGGIFSKTNIANIQQDFLTNTVNSNRQTCSTYAVEDASNNNIIVIGTNIGGDFTGVSQTLTTDASCLISSNMDTQVSNILEAAAKQKNKTSTDAFSGFNFSGDNNESNLRQHVVNNLYNTSEATCTTSSIQSASKNYVYVKNSNIGGNFIGVKQNSNSSAHCTMNNMMKVTTFNMAQAKADQSNEFTGGFANFAVAFTGILTIMIIISIIFFISKSIINSNQNIVPNIDPISAAESLGITPKILSQIK